MPAHYDFDASYFIRWQMFSQSIVLLWVTLRHYRGKLDNHATTESAWKLTQSQ